MPRVFKLSHKVLFLVVKRCSVHSRVTTPHSPSPLRLMTHGCARMVQLWQSALRLRYREDATKTCLCLRRRRARGQTVGSLDGLPSWCISVLRPFNREGLRTSRKDDVMDRSISTLLSSDVWTALAGHPYYAPAFELTRRLRHKSEPSDLETVALVVPGAQAIWQCICSRTV